MRDCCHRFLDELIPQLTDFEELYAVEVFNESGWASPHADPMNTSDGGEAENFSLRTQSAVPVVLALNGVDSAARVCLYDLETRCRTEISPDKPAGLGETDHDFILMIEG